MDAPEEQPVHAVPAAGSATDVDFDDGPQLQLDELLRQLIGQAQDVIQARGRLRGLLSANRMIIGKLDLPTVLRRIAEAARQLVGAKYAALGVLGAHGELEQFIVVGIDDATAQRIGPLPSGRGLLKVLIDDPRPIRLRRLADDPRSVGFPDGHPSMDSFLGVPIKSGDSVFGNLYLAEAPAGEFSFEDEELVTALAATAGVAIENARLYEQSERRQQWWAASAEISQQLLSSEGVDPLALIAEKTRALAGADAVSVVLPSSVDGQLIVEVAAGDGTERIVGYQYPAENSLAGLVFATQNPQIVPDVKLDVDYQLHLSQVMDIGPTMMLPLVGTAGIRGALVAARLSGRRPFEPEDLAMATTFANHASVALELAVTRADQQRMVLLEDRDRIARDLHDHVIQRLFSAGLSIQSVATRTKDPKGSDALHLVVDSIDETIRQIRTTIFQLRHSSVAGSASVRAAVLEAVNDVTPALGFEPRMTFLGPIDTVVPEDLVPDMLAVIREALTNVAKHARAEAGDVSVRAAPGSLTLVIRDDGIGSSSSTRDSGLANLRSRAEARGGSMTFGLPDQGPISDSSRPGSQLRWTVPLP